MRETDKILRWNIYGKSIFNSYNEFWLDHYNKWYKRYNRHINQNTKGARCVFLRYSNDPKRCLKCCAPNITNELKLLKRLPSFKRGINCNLILIVFKHFTSQKPADKDLSHLVSFNKDFSIISVVYLNFLPKKVHMFWCHERKSTQKMSSARKQKSLSFQTRSEMKMLEKKAKSWSVSTALHLYNVHIMKSLLSFIII